jgi:hypothetical protein
MKRIFYLLLMPLLFLACKKEKSTAPETALDFSISGLPDTVVIEQTDTLDIPFSIKYLSGRKERVVLMLTNLPASMTAGFAADINTPTFATSLRLVTHGTDTDTYTIHLTGESADLEKTADLQIKVVPNPVNPSSVLVGTYLESGPCTASGNISDTVTVTTITNSFNKIQLRGLWTGNTITKINADVDPVQHTVSIPTQVVNNASYTGYGTYSASQITINYQVTAGSTVDSCMTVLSRL